MQSTAKYKIGDILYEDRRSYKSAKGSIQSKMDAKYPICILQIVEIRPNVKWEGHTLDHRESYWCYNMTRDTYTFGAITDLDSDNSRIRLATEMEVVIYGNGRKKMETD